MSALDEGRRGLARVASDRRLRWRIYVILLAVLLLLSFFPRPYVARAKILPQENGSAAGLGSMIDVLGGRLNDYSSLLGQRNSIESYLLIGRSNEVVLDVIDRLKLVGAGRRYADLDDAEADLGRKADIHALLGGVMEIEVHANDADEARALASAYLVAINNRIGKLSRGQVQAKRNLVSDRFSDAARRVTSAEAALDAFRRRNGLAAPEAEFSAAVGQRTQLQATLQAKVVQLQTLRRFAGSDNQQLLALESDIGALRSQIARMSDAGGGVGGLNVGAITATSNQYLNLYRDYRFAQGLYDTYARFSEQVELQELAAGSGADIQVIEAPHLDTGRHYNVWAVALLWSLILLIIFIELYAPVTDLRLPFARPRDEPE